jgi:hypothetical protein
MLMPRGRRPSTAGSDKIWSEEGEREAALAAGRANALDASMRSFLCSPLVVVGKGLKLISNR